MYHVTHEGRGVSEVPHVQGALMGCCFGFDSMGLHTWSTPAIAMGLVVQGDAQVE